MSKIKVVLKKRVNAIRDIFTTKVRKSAVFIPLINGIAWYCIVLYCVFGFGARAVSHKTPIYFMQVYFWEIGHHPLCGDNLICQGDKLCCLIEKWYFLKA